MSFGCVLPAINTAVSTSARATSQGYIIRWSPNFIEAVRRESARVELSNKPSGEVAALGLVDIEWRPRVALLGDSTCDGPAASGFCASITLMYGSVASDMTWEVPCVLWKCLLHSLIREGRVRKLGELRWSRARETETTDFRGSFVGFFVGTDSRRLEDLLGIVIIEGAASGFRIRGFWSHLACFLCLSLYML